MFGDNLNIGEKRYDYLVSQLKAINSQLEEQKILKKDILDFKEACKYLNISESLLYKLTSKGEITFSKPRGGKLYFKKAELDSWCIKETSKSESELKAEAKKWVYSHLKEKGGTSNDR